MATDTDVLPVEGLEFGFEFDTDLELLTKQAHAQAQAAESDTVSTEEKDGTWIVEGYAATSDVDLDNDTITPDALKSAAQDLKDLSTVLFNHDREQPIGKVLDAELRDGNRLWVKVLISKTVPKTWKRIQEGVINKFSVRGRILKQHEKFNSALRKRVRVVDSVKLVEVSLVSVPANANAKTVSWYIQKALNTLPEVEPVSQKIETLEDLEKYLQGLQGDANDDAKADIKSALEFLAEVKKAADEAGGGEGDEGDAVIQLELPENFEQSVADAIVKKLSEGEGSLKAMMAEAVNPVAEAVKSLTEVPKALETMTSAITVLTEKALTTQKPAESNNDGLEKALKDLTDKIDKIPVRRGSGPTDGNETGGGEGGEEEGGAVEQLLKSDEYTKQDDPSAKLGLLIQTVLTDDSNE